MEEKFAIYEIVADEYQLEMLVHLGSYDLEQDAKFILQEKIMFDKNSSQKFTILPIYSWQKN